MLGLCAALDCKEKEKMATEETDVLDFFLCFLVVSNRGEFNPSFCPRESEM